MNIEKITVAVSDAEMLISQGNEYYYGEGVELNLEKAVHCYEQAANLGSAEAKCLLGYCLKKGIGGAADADRAFRLFLESADQGFPMAMYNLGECFEKGVGCDIDIDKSQHWYQQAQALGYKE